MKYATKLFTVAIVIFSVAISASSFNGINRSLDRLDAKLTIMEIAIDEVGKFHVKEALKYAPEGFTRYQLRGFAQTQAQQLLDQLTDHYNLPRYELSTIRFVPSLRESSAGIATNCKNEFGVPNTNLVISLNEILFLRNYNDFMKHIIPHEVSHVITCLKGGFPQEDGEDFWTAAHGEEWVEAMLVLGFLNPEYYRTHRLDMMPVVLYQRDLFKILSERLGEYNEKE